MHTYTQASRCHGRSMFSGVQPRPNCGEPSTSRVNRGTGSRPELQVRTPPGVPITDGERSLALRASRSGIAC
jgi:hypothetical protein